MGSADAPRSGKAAKRGATRGFSYLLVLVVIAALSVAAAYSLQIGHTLQRRQAEEALLVAGEEFERALASYRLAGASGMLGAPTSHRPADLQALLRDPRVPGIRRHLRRIPADPLTGRADWGLVRDADGRIAAVFSLAPGLPIKRAGFSPRQQGFEEAPAYSAWHFGEGVPPAPVVRP